MKIPRWIIVARDGSSVTTITANTEESAWRKFCWQYFGVLKPSREDYKITPAVSLAKLHWRKRHESRGEVQAALLG